MEFEDENEDFEEEIEAAKKMECSHCKGKVSFSATGFYCNSCKRKV